MDDTAAQPAPELTGEQIVEATEQPIKQDEPVAQEVKPEEEQPTSEQAKEEPAKQDPEEPAPKEEPTPEVAEDATGKRKLDEYVGQEQQESKRMNTGEAQDMQMEGTGHVAEPVDISAGDLPEDAPDASGQMVGFVSCPEALVSKLIGKKGSVIQTLESMTGAKIQVEHQKPGDPKHVRIIAKSQEDLDNTKKTIKDTLEAEHPLGEVTKVMSCPHAMVGRIIGRSGQTILSLQQASQAKIIVDQDAERFPEGAPRDVRIIGMAHCVERAEKMVDELMNAEPGVSAQSVIQKYGLGSSKTMDCPRGMVGRVIGKQGDTIKQLQRNTGANIQIDQKTDPCQITVTGHQSSINHAMREITAIISDTGMGGGYGARDAGGMGGGYGSYAGYAQQGGYAAPWGGYQQPQQSFNPYQGAYQGGYQQPQAYPAYNQDAGAGYGGSGGYGNVGYPQQAQQGGMPGHAWSEEFDANSQRNYYYNSVTGATQWEKPAEMM